MAREVQEPDSPAISAAHVSAEYGNSVRHSASRAPASGLRHDALFRTLTLLRPESSHGPTYPRLDVLRSSQLDAARLDDELGSMLKDQFMGIFSFFPPGTVSKFHPELVALLDLFIFHFSVWKGRPLPGMALMNLRYRNERLTRSDPLVSGRTGVEGPGLTMRQRVLFGLGSVGLRYGWARLGRAAAVGRWAESSEGHGRALLKVLRNVDTAYRLASLMNLLVFLRAGKYRSILERLLCARPVYGEAVAARSISFEYLNRQLVWSELSEVLLFLLPLIDVQATKRTVRRWLPAVSSVLRSKTPSASTDDAESINEPCALCNKSDSAIRVRAMPCGHIYCYHCLRAATENDADLQCVACLKQVTSMRRIVVR